MIDGFWCLRCLNDHITLPDIIGTIAAGTIDPLVAKNWIAVLGYLEAKYDYDYYTLFVAFG